MRLNLQLQRDQEKGSRGVLRPQNLGQGQSPGKGVHQQEKGHHCQGDEEVLLHRKEQERGLPPLPQRKVGVRVLQDEEGQCPRDQLEEVPGLPKGQGHLKGLEGGLHQILYLQEDILLCHLGVDLDHQDEGGQGLQDVGQGHLVDQGHPIEDSLDLDQEVMEEEQRKELLLQLNANEDTAVAHLLEVVPVPGHHGDVSGRLAAVILAEAERLLDDEGRRAPVIVGVEVDLRKCLLVQTLALIVPCFVNSIVGNIVF